MPTAKSAMMFLAGGLSVAFLGAAGKDGWEVTKEFAKPYFQLSASTSGGNWVTDSVTPIYDYIDTFTPKRAHATKNTQSSNANNATTIPTPDSDILHPSSIDTYTLPKKTPSKPKRQSSMDTGWVDVGYYDLYEPIYSNKH